MLAIRTEKVNDSAIIRVVPFVEEFKIITITAKETTIEIGIEAIWVRENSGGR